MLIKNRLNSPQTIHTATGPVILPAGGKIEADALHPAYDALYRASRFVEINTEVEATAKRGPGRPRKADSQ